VTHDITAKIVFTRCNAG